jgi:CubicO group peptidase (beta-lactamase class C family)
VSHVLNKLFKGFFAFFAVLCFFGALQTGVFTTDEATIAETVQQDEDKGNAPSPSNENEFEGVISSLREYVSSARKQWKSPGVAVGIILNGKVYFINDGVANLETGQKITENSIFCVMSLSKAITVSVIHQLVDEGKINLDDPVVNYLPWFKLAEGTQDVKVRHLISHCIGLPKFSADTLWHIGFTQKEIIEKLSVIPVCAKPGEKYAYQNMFVGIAGLLIESVLKKPLKEVVDERIFKPLGMGHSSMGSHPSGFWGKISQFFKKEKQHDSDLLVTGYINLGGAQSASISTDEPYLFEGTSGVNSSTADFLKFVNCIINGGVIRSGENAGGNAGGNAGKTLLSPRALQDMTTKQVHISDIRNSSSHFPVSRMKPGSFYYGNGVFGFMYGSGEKYEKLLMHEGAGAGWRSIWVALPEHGFGVVVLVNHGSINSNLLPESIAYRVLDSYLHTVYSASSQPSLPDINWSDLFYKSFLSSKKYFKHRFDSYVLGPPPAFESLLGEYESNVYGTLKIASKDNDDLVVKYRGRDIPLKHVGGTVFAFDSNKLTPRYGDDDHGELYFKTDDKRTSKQEAEKKVVGLNIGLLREADFKKK